MTEHANLPTCDDILNLSPDAVPQLVRDMSQRRQLSAMVRSLNVKVLEGDAATQDLARTVLTRLGFVML